MGLSSDLISQFVKVTKDETKTKKETITYGTIVESEGVKYVQLDGSKILTPLSSIQSTADVDKDDRVTVMIKNHTATITGNLSNPSATYIINTSGDSEKVVDVISEFDKAVADKVSTKDLEAQKARIDVLQADNVVIKEQLIANDAAIDDLVAENATITEKLIANEADISNLKTTKLDAVIADVKYATVEKLDAANADIHNLESTYADFEVATTNRLSAVDATIESLQTNKLSAEEAALTYANIDFSNIGEAAIEHFYATSGLIEDVTVENGTITGKLVGVTISGDLIEGNTIVAEKLVIKGDDGLYYKLNADGETVEAQQTDYNSLNGQVIRAKSVTAEKIDVSDLVAFDATIGGFKIDEDSISSIVKDSVGNTVCGTYLGNDGQISFGDANNYIKYYKDENGEYQLAISSQAMRVNASDIDLCGDKARIEFDAEDNYLQITGEYLRLRGDSMSSLYSTYYDNQSFGQKSAVNVSPGSVEVYAQESEDIDPDSLAGVWNTSRVAVSPDRIVLESDVISINGHEYAKNKILWEGALRMDSSETAYLSEWVSQQVTGIVLVFSRYSNDVVHDYHFQTHFVPKSQVDKHHGCGHTFLLSTDGKFSIFAAKYLYVNNNCLAGNDVNVESGTGACGISYNNGGFVLRYVIGV